ncbi:dGTPase [Vibrio parahaemolyticus]|uniref:dGTPase n=1 Tax=Vibrio parahaemolyticus TaxID=670 RepID=UPI001EED3791|nr:dGTPase [Vibrio parahaemolyticus]MCG0014577.1 dGTPase [Vibrio parahaemolyticus]MDL2000025.1 dGTPase [Vibrio parahaemolyticus]
MSTYPYINSARLRKSSVDGRSVYEEALSDQGRVIFSGPFRRLQSKAQVFPLEENASVRSRLTHSIEVANIGKFIAREIINKLNSCSIKNKNKNSSRQEICELERAFETFSETACLIHDIGNPPFGHFGETAIKQWFSIKGNQSFIKSISNTNKEIAQRREQGTHPDYLAPNTDHEYEHYLKHDFENFDGNAQGLRIICRVQGDFDRLGLNLTTTQLSGFMKYVACSDNIDRSKNSYFSKKPGYFLTEKGIVHEIRKVLFGDENIRKRHPIAFVMEAADDIAYCISDIEDGLEKQVISFESIKIELKPLYIDVCKNYGIKKKVYKRFWKATTNKLFKEVNENPQYTLFTRLRVKHILQQVDGASQIYVDNLKAIREGNYNHSLIAKPSVHHAWLKALKIYTERNIYLSPSVVTPELSGLSIITGILEKYKCILELSANAFSRIVDPLDVTVNEKELSIETLLISGLPSSYIELYKSSVSSFREGDYKPVGDNYYTNEWLFRAHLILDYVSSMTDDFAFRTFKILSGNSHKPPKY